MFHTLNHKAYLVGGAIRNELIGLEAKDLDFVIEASIEEFHKVFPIDEISKIGNSFPVFLINNNEVALTRTEISIGDGYTSFEIENVGVSIEEDLSRRDFTINSIAKHYVTGEIVDPFNGVEDLKNGIIRTINESAFEEDPLRIYRAFRFAAEFNFSVEENTIELIKKSINKLKFINPERVFLELKKVYERSENPSIFFKLLSKVDGLKIHFKPLYVLSKVPAGPVKYHGNNTGLDHVLEAFDRSKHHGYSFDVALAVLFHDTGKGITKKELLPKHHGHEIKSYIINEEFVKQHRFTAKQNELIVLVARNHMTFHDLTEIKKVVKLIRFYKRIRKFSTEIIQAANCDHALSIEQLQILKKLEKTFKETVIQIPPTVKGKEAITNFVEQRYVSFYKSCL